MPRGSCEPSSRRNRTARRGCSSSSVRCTTRSGSTTRRFACSTRSLALRRTLFGENSHEVAEARHWRGLSEHYAGSYDAAEASFRQRSWHSPAPGGGAGSRRRSSRWSSSAICCTPGDACSRPSRSCATPLGRFRPPERHPAAALRPARRGRGPSCISRTSSATAASSTSRRCCSTARSMASARSMESAISRSPSPSPTSRGCTSCAAIHEAERLLTHALGVLRVTYGDAHPLVATALREPAIFGLKGPARRGRVGARRGAAHPSGLSGRPIRWSPETVPIRRSWRCGAADGRGGAAGARHARRFRPPRHARPSVGDRRARDARPGAVRDRQSRRGSRASARPGERRAPVRLRRRADLAASRRERSRVGSALTRAGSDASVRLAHPYCTSPSSLPGAAPVAGVDRQFRLRRRRARSVP